jgi:hypothetical protein
MSRTEMATPPPPNRFEHFNRLIDSASQEQPIWFALEPDQPPSAGQIEHAQQQLNCLLPEDYLSFISRYGGGYFGLGIVYSLDEASDFNLIQRNQQCAHLRGAHVVFSDNGCGDLYGFPISKGHCLPQVSIYLHDNDSWSRLDDRGFLHFLLGQSIDYREHP